MTKLELIKILTDYDCASKAKNLSISEFVEEHFALINSKALDKIPNVIDNEAKKKICLKFLNGRCSMNYPSDFCSTCDNYE